MNAQQSRSTASSRVFFHGSSAVIGVAGYSPLKGWCLLLLLCIRSAHLGMVREPQGISQERCLLIQRYMFFVRFMPMQEKKVLTSPFENQREN